MVAQMIMFPKKPEENAMELERMIRGWLKEMDAQQDMTEYVVKRLLDFIDQYASKTFEPVYKLAVPPGLSKEAADALLVSVKQGIAHTAEEVHLMINKIIVERFFVEIELYENRREVKNQRKLVK